MSRRWKAFLIFLWNMRRTRASEQDTFLEGRIFHWHENQDSTLPNIQQTLLVGRETGFPYSYPNDARGRDRSLIHTPQPPVCLPMVLQVKSHHGNHEEKPAIFSKEITCITRKHSEVVIKAKLTNWFLQQHWSKYQCINYYHNKQPNSK